ncbi:Dps family protein [Selenomonas sp. TAMA-11512]|uniref:Dps family protein n=1 Tax=Selenomonas sp. TAMA-11512 TaxID=3095337 RepID=UPI0030850ED2|nr:Dps family protein [Selenomonas sp. TAMA-11512]
MNQQELTKELNSYIANIGVGYIKLHNLHWNVVGSQFKAVHEYLESLYDAFADVLDETAELLKINGEQPVASLKGYLAIATIKELDDAAVDQKKALEITLADLELLRDQALKIRKAANEHDCFSAANLMEDHIENYAKQIWFLRSMLA